MREPVISAYLQERIGAGDFPSAVYVVWDKGAVVFAAAEGDAVVAPARILAQLNTIYDLASVTKVLATTLIAASLIEQGELGLDDPLARFFDSGSLRDKADLTLGQIFSHTTGLPGWLPFYLLVAEREQILDEIVRTPYNADRDAVVYGDPNFWLATFVIERILNESIDQSFERIVAKPLGLKETIFKPSADLKPRIAASENGTAFERQLCRDLGYDFMTNRMTGKVPFRDEPIWGDLHDNNGYFFGSIAGHAGLFSTAHEVLQLGLQFLPAYTSILKPETCSLFLTDVTPGGNEARSFGFEIASSPETTAGILMSPQSFGHLGFTGTSLWIDPVSERVFILLTNRTHNHPLPLVNMNPVRRRFHDLAVTALDANN